MLRSSPVWIRTSARSELRDERGDEPEVKSAERAGANLGSSNRILMPLPEGNATLPERVRREGDTWSTVHVLVQRQRQQRPKWTLKMLIKCWPGVESADRQILTTTDRST